MSGTTKSAESMTTGSERSAKANQTASARNGVNHSAAAEDLMSETVAEAVVAATKISSTVAEETKQNLMTGVRTVSGVGGHVADISFGLGRDMLASAKRTMDVYCGTSERSAEGVQALFSSRTAIGRTWQQTQSAWLEVFDQSLKQSTHTPLDLLRCKTLVEFVELQRDLYIDALNHPIRSSGRMLDVMNHTAREAVRPLQIIRQSAFLKSGRRHVE